MKRSLVAISAYVTIALLVGLAVPVMAAPTHQELGTVVVGTNAEYPPFEFVDEEGNIVGFDVDLMNAIAEIAGFEVEWVNTRWDGIFVALQSGEFDAVISAATITEEREEIVDFSDPYFNAGQVVAVRIEDADTITGPDDLPGLRVGVQQGTTGDIAVSEMEGVEVVRFDEITLAMQALANGDVDAVVNDGPTTADIIANNPELELTIVGDPFTDELYGIAVNPERPDLLDAINAALAEVIANGTYAEIYQNWFGTEPPAQFMPAEEAGAALGTVVVGTNAEYPPFEFVDEEGNIVGFDVDLMNAIAEVAGFEVEWVNTRWDGIFVALQSGEFDAVISAATITEEREEIVDFSDPYFNAGQVVAVRIEDADTITGPDDLPGLRVGVQQGTTGDIAVSEMEGVEVVRFDEITLAMQALANGDVDAVVNDGPTTADIIANNPELELTIVGDPFTDELYGIAVNPERPDLLDAINAALAEVIANGTYAEIYQNWFGTEPPAQFMPAEE